VSIISLSYLQTPPEMVTPVCHRGPTTPLLLDIPYPLNAPTCAECVSPLVQICQSFPTWRTSRRKSWPHRLLHHPGKLCQHPPRCGHVRFDPDSSLSALVTYVWMLSPSFIPRPPVLGH